MNRTVEQQLHGFVDDLEKALKYDYGKPIDCNNVVLCGMGGSAISGIIVADCCEESSIKPIIINKSPVMPEWIDNNTFAIVSTYSGDTIETLEMYSIAKQKNCKIVCITSGGKILDLCKKDNIDYILLPNDMEPRHSIGHMIGYTFSLLRAAGCSILPKNFKKVIKGLRKYRDELEKTDYCKKIYDEIKDTVPVICSGDIMQSASFRWKTQINENAKLVAFCGTTGDFKYSTADVWLNSSQKECTLLLITDKKNERYCNEISQKMKNLNVHSVEINLNGKTMLEDMFRAVMLGDYLSLLTAIERGVEPSAVKPIRYLKDNYLCKIN